MPTPRNERETLVIFTDADRLNGGFARIYTFDPRLKAKALRNGGFVVQEHARDGKIEAWDIDVLASLVRIGFKNRAKAEAASRRMKGKKPGASVAG